MKKTFFSFALAAAALFLSPLTSKAQSGFSVGIKGGVNLSRLTFGEFVTTRLNANGSPAVSVSGQEIRDNLRESFDSRTGTVFGIYTRFGRNLYLQPEFLYSRKSGTFEIVRDGQPSTINVSVSSFDVPVLLGLKGGPFRVVAGPVVSFRIDDNRRLQDALRDYTTGTLNDAWAKAYYGYQLGAGLDLGKLGIDVRREGSISDVAAVNLGASGNSAQFSQKLKSWQVTLAYRLF
ncbi:hypothetical protein GCM10023189_57860 [Nibrella saemangeumensis]|uniref:Outer membrane protein beta-barrel domain-containing protein n=1 Tax=Nibrella saemangeumensis TaxID=1084526 RepID=A0ABP8NS61_9BACT